MVDKEQNIEECYICGEGHEACPLLEDSIHVPDEVPLSRARLTLPKCLALSERTDAEAVVVARNSISRGTRFGPLEARRVKKCAPSTKLPFRVFKSDKRSSLFLDTANEDACNWMCLVGPPDDPETQYNVMAYQMEDQIYFICCKDLVEGEEMKIEYSPYYAKKMEEFKKSSVDSVEQKSLQTDEQFSSRPAETVPDPADGTPVRRKRGRPPKDSKLSLKQHLGDVQTPTEPQIQAELGPKELGVQVEKDRWTCSRCGARFEHCLLFAKHLQRHYRPAYLSYRGRCKLRARQRNHRSWQTNSGQGEKSFPDLVDDINEEPASSANHEERSVDEMQEPEKLDVGARTENGDLTNAASENKDSSSPQEIEAIPSVQLTNGETPTPYTGRKRGRKRKGEAPSSPKEEEVVLKRYKPIARLSSQTASSKYNLRTTRKALVVSEDEFDAEDTSDEDFESDYDSEELEEGEIRQTTLTVDSRGDEMPKVSASHLVAASKSNANPDGSVRLLSGEVDSDVAAAAEALKELLSADNSTSLPSLQNPQETIVERNASGGGAESEDAGRRRTDPRAITEQTESSYTCDLCNKRFDKPEYLYRHIRKHTGEFTCRGCRKAFARKENMMKHDCPGRGASGNHRCPECGKLFASEIALRHHEVKHVKKYGCTECGKSYCRKDMLLNHSCSSKPSDGNFKCNICQKTFAKELYLLRHIPVHTGEHACPICGKWLRSLLSLTHHLRVCRLVKEIQDNGKAQCPACHLEFTDGVAYRRHQFEHTHMHACDKCGARFRNQISQRRHLCQGKLFSCEACSATARNREELREHEATHGEKSFRCPKCEQSFFRKESLTGHLCKNVADILASAVVSRSKKALSLLPLVCETCGSTFASASSLKVHRELHGEKKFACNVCDKRFHRKDMLLEHYAVHGEATFPCPSCHKLFKTKKSLDTHVMIHDGIKKFKCTTCGKAFFQKGNLMKHEETHKGLRKHICSICQKSFCTKDYLNTHILEHTQGRVYSCSICDRSFVKEHQLRSHHKMFHGSQRYVCKYCGMSFKMRLSLRRHLKRKHSQHEAEWKTAGAVDAMLTKREDERQFLQEGSTESVVDPSAELHLVPDANGAEVLLAVARIDSQELQEALATGRAKIKQGPAPNTFEISLSVPSESASEYIFAEGGEQPFIPGTDAALESLQQSELQMQNDAGPETESEASAAACFPDVIAEDAQGKEGGRQQEIVLEVQEPESSRPADDLSALVREQIAGCEDRAAGSGTALGGQRPEEAFPADEEREQEIVIEDENGTQHRILFDSSALQQTVGQNGVEQMQQPEQAEGTFILENGTIFTQEAAENGAADLLLYVLTTSEVE